MDPKEMKSSVRMFEEITKNIGHVKDHFSGPSPPEIFVGRIGYPNINIGILAPTTFETKHDTFNTAESWSHANLSIANVLRLRGQMIYARTKGSIKQPSSVTQTMHELALTHKKTATEFFLKKQPQLGSIKSSQITRPLLNPAPIKKVSLEENTSILKKVDYIVNDTDAKATDAIKELVSIINVEHMQKLLAAGLLGQKKERKMVPTRWSITAVDDSLSKQMLERIRTYDEIDHIEILEGNFLGNYITILLLPGMFSFEAIECWEGKNKEAIIASDYEGYSGRKSYASQVTGGYYAMRLPVCEYLTTIKKQATVLVLREITNEYYAPLGVGIVRETARRATQSKPLLFETKDIACSYITTKQHLHHEAVSHSWILQNYKKQSTLQNFL